MMEPSTTQSGEAVAETVPSASPPQKTTRRRLSKRSWAVVLLLVLLVIVAILLRGIHPFLAVNAPVEADVLVVEGWVADYAFEAASRKFSQGGYQMIYVTGGPMERGAPLSEYKTYAALGAAVLDVLQVPTNQLQAVPAPKVKRERTYISALALRDWFEKNEIQPQQINLMTIGVHARRSRLMFERAFGSSVEVGIICVEDENYDPNRWWAYSQGVRMVLGETVGYVYARLFFRVSAEAVPDTPTAEVDLISP